MTHHCEVPGCEVLPLGGERICTRHWNMVPVLIRDRIIAAAKKLRAAPDGGPVRATAELEYGAAFSGAVNHILCAKPARIGLPAHYPSGPRIA